ncbi:MAG TPA: oxidoreductase [Mycobacteriales bacterium]|nr:oxidoreductase [Mycobacteriales bacterium]
MTEPVTEPVGVGLVGFGMAAQSLHVPLIGAEPRLALRAVVSSDPAKVHRDLPAVPVVSTMDDLLTDPAVELVVVAAPTAVHAELAAAALRAGRHVVVDKPLAVTVAEADELVGLAAAAGRQLAAFHQRRWDSDHLSLARCVHSGQLGRVRTYQARYDRFRPEVVDRWRERPGPGAGLLYDLGSHLVDQALRLFGPPATVWADVGTQRPGAQVDDYFHLVLGYGPLRAILHAGSLVLAPGPRLEVHGDAGSFVWDGIDGQVAALLAGQRPGDPGWGETGGAGTLTTVDGARPVDRVRGAYETFYRQLAAAVRGEGPVPVPATEAREVIRVLQYAQRSSAEGRTLPLD